MPAPLRAMATNRGAEIREGNERGSASEPGCRPSNSAARLAIGSTLAMRSDFCFRSASYSHRLPIGAAHHRQPIAGEWRQ